MNTLEVALSVADQLRRAGIACVIAGGAARDTYHSREPKDYDIVVLDDYDVEESLRVIDEDVKGTRNLDFFGPGSSMRDCEDVNLDWVIKFEVDGVSFDLIQFSNHPNTPIEAVESFDCTLNMVWINEHGGVETHCLFPAPGDKIILTDRCDHPARRVEYLRSKYPDFEWPDVHSIRAHRNYRPTVAPAYELPA